MSKQKIKLQPEDPKIWGPLSFFVEYQLNGGIVTYGGTVREIKEKLDYSLGKGNFSLQHEKGKIDD